MDQGMKEREGVGACSFFPPPPAVAAWRFVVFREQINWGASLLFLL